MFVLVRMKLQSKSTVTFLDGIHPSILINLPYEVPVDKTRFFGAKTMMIMPVITGTSTERNVADVYNQLGFLGICR
nr:hypothetical protein Iba_chr13cCG3320 [Ipomoea batatas]